MLKFTSLMDLLLRTEGAQMVYKGVSKIFRTDAVKFIKLSKGLLAAITREVVPSRV
jgi:hypothetical protein